MGIDPITGMPEELSVGTSLDRETAQIQVFVVKRRFGKLVTVVEGINKNEVKDVASKLKSKLACGGTAKDNIIELQGDHKRRMKDILVSLGFDKGNINIK